jgi:transposase InsO family protein
VTTAYNPQANGIIERVHLVLADALRTYELQERELDPNDPWSSLLVHLLQSEALITLR